VKGTLGENQKMGREKVKKEVENPPQLVGKRSNGVAK